MVQTDKNNLVKAAAINALAGLKASGNANLFKQALNSQSYAVQGSALNALNQLDPASSLALAKSLEKDSDGQLAQSILNIYAINGGDAEWPYVNRKFDEADVQGKFSVMRNYVAYIGRLQKSEYAQQGIEQIKAVGVRYKQYGIGQALVNFLQTIKDQRAKMNDTASVNAADNAIKQLQ
jgi:aminopeptidase N